MIDTEVAMLRRSQTKDSRIVYSTIRDMIILAVWIERNGKYLSLCLALVV